MAKETFPNENLRQLMRLVNQYFMVPAYRLGLGAMVSSPISGYMMVLKTVGRKTGRVRYTPVNYAIQDGCVYCIAGWGSKADWYHNALANRQLEVLLPVGTLAGAIEEVSDPEECLRVGRQILRNAGFAGFFLGENPYRVSDEVLRQKMEGIPVLRIRPDGIGSGPADPGGWLWVLMTVISGAWLAGILFRRRKTKDE